MIYNGLGSNWWVGVVEDRNDPEKLGRCKVRIFGYHPEDTSLLSTKDLPWALLMTPATSASISGVGMSPVGVLQGSWVVGFFIDGDDKQQPIIVGTVPGKPQNPGEQSESEAQASEPGSTGLVNTDGQPVLDGSGKPIQTGSSEITPNQQDPTPGRAVDSTVGALTGDDVQKLLTSLQAGSTAPGKVGKYNFTVENLSYLGYLRPLPKNINPTEAYSNPSNWTGKDNVKSLSDIETDNYRQDYMAADLVKKLYSDLAKAGKINDKSPKAYTAGLITSAIRMGVKNADKFDIKDKDNAFASEHYGAGASLFGDPTPPAPKADVGNQQGNFGGSPTNPGNEPSGQLNDLKALGATGFSDPDKAYPTKEYLDKGLPDTNKLATGDKSANILLYKEANRLEDIAIGYSEDTWSEPESPYSAKYPHNQVVYTEAGHVIELDNTPGRERIQVYHKSNTFIEIDVNGTHVKKVVGDDYEIVEKNSYVYVKGAAKTTVEGVQRLLVKDSMFVQIWGDINVVGQSDIKINGAKKVNLTGTDEVKIQSTGPVQVSTDQEITLQGSRINLNPGGVDNAFDKPPKQSPKGNEPKPLIAPTTSQEDLEFESGEEGSEEYAAQREESGDIVDKQPGIADQDNTGPKDIRASRVDRTEFAAASNLPDTMRLSDEFTLGALTSRAGASPTQLQDNSGLTEGEIAGNLKALATNCLDPIKKKYPEMFVTSGFRTGSGTSDHSVGAAADMQFKGKSAEDYYEICRWIRDNVPYKQLLLEYQDKSGGRIAWIHIAYREDTPQSALPLATFYNHKVYKRNSLVKLT